MVSREFVVLDTEGTPTLREVAVFNHRGQLLYEARTPQEGDYYAADLARSLPEILHQLSSLLAGKTIVAHNADHDRQILLNSYAEVGLAVPEMQFECTCNLARSLHFGLESYNLGYLCDVLEVSPEPFSRDQAHQAAYDARYTYYLYRTLKRSQLAKTLAAGSSPFSSSRVDTPFQHFADDQAVYKDEYQRLKAVLHSISLDPNHQSKGAVIIGEPGTGKTHLMMRLAQDVLKQNRLLFIRQPTQESTILFHTYSRILESLVEPVGDDQHNQLDLLLIRSIRSIFAEIPEAKQTVSDREVIEALDAEDLAEITQQRSIRSSLNRANEFYAYRVQGVPLPTSAPLIPTGGNLDTSAMANRLIRLEQQVQQLQTLIQKLLASPAAGRSGISQEVRVEVIEAIARDPMTVSASNSPYAPEFHRYCSYQRRTLQERWSESRIINDSDDLGKLHQICQAFKQIKTLAISALRRGRSVVPDNLVIRDPKGERCLAFLHISNGTSICARLTNMNQLVLSNPKMTFILMRDRTVGDIRSPKASQALEAFRNGTGDGRKRTHYQVLSLEQRVDLELVHQLVSDINNRDLEILMPDALNLLVQQEPQNWIVKLVARAESL